MLPILYAPSAIKDADSMLSGNGLGFVTQCTSCTVTEERNGSYELTMTVLTSDRLINDITVCAFVKVKANPQDDPQLFEVYSTSITDTEITVNAQHVRYMMNHYWVQEPYNSGTPTECFAEMESGGLIGDDEITPTFTSDITTSAEVGSDIAGAVSLGEWLMGVDSSVLDVFGGEYHYDNFAVELLKSRGKSSGVCLRYGSNISSYTQEANAEKLYTAIVPYATEVDMVDEDGNSLDTKWTVNMSSLVKYIVYVNILQSDDSPLAHHRVLLYDFTDDLSSDGVTITCSQTAGGAYIPTDDALGALAVELRARARAYLNSDDNLSTFQEPSFSVTVNTVEGLDSLSECALCDTVSIYYPPAGTTSTAKIIATTYDSLNERYTSLELGTAKKTIADLINVKNIGGA